MEIYQQDDGVFIICQKKYAENILAEFGMIDCKPMSTSFVVNENIVKEDIMSTWYGSLVGNLLYLIATRPKIMYASSLLFRFMNNPSQLHFGTVKRVLRYIKGTLNFGIKFGKRVDAQLFGYCDNN